MKIAFLHGASDQTDDLFQRFTASLVGHDILSWRTGDFPPSDDIRILLARGPVVRTQLEPLFALELIQTLSAGYDSVDLDGASELGIWVSNAPAGLTGNAESVAEFAVMLLIGASRQLARELRFDVDKALAPAVPRRALYGKTICVVGLGSIGRCLIERLRPFGVTLIATDAGSSPPPPGVKLYPAEKLHQAVSTADYAVICVPGSAANGNLIDGSVLDAMPRGAILVNVARGNVVDEVALAAALRSGRLSAVGLDVLRTEPGRSNEPLLSFPQALVTPHIAGDTDLTQHGTLAYIAAVVEGWGAGRKPASIVNQPLHPRIPYP